MTNGANVSMRIGVHKEIKNHEYRVGLTPASVKDLVAHGHELFVETKAGSGIDCPDSAYEKAGAKILPDAQSVFDSSDMIVKVKEPPPLRRQGPGARPHEVGRDLHRLGNGDGAQRLAPAAEADERGRGPHVSAG